MKLHNFPLLEARSLAVVRKLLKFLKSITQNSPTHSFSDDIDIETQYVRVYRSYKNFFIVHHSYFVTEEIPFYRKRVRELLSPEVLLFVPIVLFFASRLN
jgi:hypothetical protein